MRSLEARAEELRKSGAIEKLFERADPDVRRASHEVNGPLLEELTLSTAYHDASCVDSFRSGGPYYMDYWQRQVTVLL